MLSVPALVLYQIRPKFARHRRARQRRRLLHASSMYNTAPLPECVRPLMPCHELAAAATSTGTVLCIGGYLVGDEHCPWLYGPTDVRY